MLTIRAASSSTSYPLCLPFTGCPAPERRFPTDSPSINKTWLAQYALAERPAPDWNRLDWPVWGLLRYAEMHVLLTGDDWYALSATFITNSGNRVTVAYDDTVGGSGTVALRVVDATPIADCRAAPSGLPLADASVLWHLTLTDERYFWAQRVHDGTGNDMADWGHLVAALILKAADVSVSPTALQSALVAAGATQYDTPSTVWTSDNIKGQNLAGLVDSACAAVNLRVVVGLDASVTVQTHVGATAALLTPIGDLAAGGYRLGTRALVHDLVFYNRGGVVSTLTQSVPTGVSGTLTSWIPHSSSNAVARYVTDYANWTAPHVPHMTLAGFPAPPATAMVDRWVLDHDGATSSLLSDGAHYPWPLIGGLPVAPADRLVNVCLVRDAYGVVTGMRTSWERSDGSIVCNDVGDCPTCPPPPPGSGSITGHVVNGSGTRLLGRTLTLSGATTGSTTTGLPGGLYTFSGVNNGSNTVTLTLLGGETATYQVDGGAVTAGNAGSCTVASDAHVINFVVTP